MILEEDLHVSIYPSTGLIHYVGFENHEGGVHITITKCKVAVSGHKPLQKARAGL